MDVQKYSDADSMKYYATCWEEIVGKIQMWKINLDGEHFCTKSDLKKYAGKFPHCVIQRKNALPDVITIIPNPNVINGWVNAKEFEYVRIENGNYWIYNEGGFKNKKLNLVIFDK